VQKNYWLEMTEVARNLIIMSYEDTFHAQIMAWDAVVIAAQAARACAFAASDAELAVLLDAAVTATTAVATAVERVGAVAVFEPALSARAACTLNAIACDYRDAYDVSWAAMAAACAHDALNPALSGCVVTNARAAAKAALYLCEKAALACMQPETRADVC
jgi:hypothetical protein